MEIVCGDEASVPARGRAEEEAVRTCWRRCGDGVPQVYRRHREMISDGFCGVKQVFDKNLTKKHSRQTGEILSKRTTRILTIFRNYFIIYIARARIIF